MLRTLAVVVLALAGCKAKNKDEGATTNSAAPAPTAPTTVEPVAKMAPPPEQAGSATATATATGSASATGSAATTPESGARKQPTAADDELMKILVDAKVDSEDGMSQTRSYVRNVVCTETAKGDATCTSPKLTPELSKRLVANLKARKIDGKKTSDTTTYSVSELHCTWFNEVKGADGPADACDVTP